MYPIVIFAAAVNLPMPPAFAADQPSDEAVSEFVDELAEEKSRAYYAARQEVIAAARSGDLAGVRSRVAALVAERRGGGGAERELAGELASASFNLDEVGEPEIARHVSAMAREALNRVWAGGNDEEAVWAGLIEAALWEHVERDRESARAAYRRVLERAPDNAAAQDGLARLDLFDAVTAQKIKEQEQLHAEATAMGVQR